MPTTYLYSDPHFSHMGVCRFLRTDGVTKLRPFETPEEMDEVLVANFNSTVKPNDKVYFLGDIAINRRGLNVLARLNGDKVLIKGNHDIFKLNDYTPYFRDIRSYHVMNGCILSHIPLHPSTLYRFGCNIHGHLHEHRVMMTNEHGVDVIDPRYYSVCVEQINYRPISFDEVSAKIIEQGGTVGFKEQ